MKTDLFVKVCGVTRVEDAILAAGHGARAVGLVFHPESPRRVNTATARRIAAALPAGVLAVGVFAAGDDDGIRETLRAVGLDLVQLHGPGAGAAALRLDPSRCVVAVTSPDEEAEALASGAAYLLSDRPRSGGVPHGKEADRALALRLSGAHSRLLLAGGLDPSNVFRAVSAVRPFGVDVSGGVEVEGAPGIKDPGKLESFFAALSGKEVRHASGK